MNTKRIITALIVLIFSLVVSGVAFANAPAEETAGAKEMTIRIGAVTRWGIPPTGRIGRCRVAFDP